MTTIRPLSCQLGLLKDADGSARFSFGHTSVLCTVFGPTDVRISDEQPDRAVVIVTISRPTPHDRKMEHLIKSSIEGAIMTSSHPRTAIHVRLQVEYDDGGLLAACVNASFLALADAGIPLHHQVAAISASSTPQNHVVMDPSNRDLRMNGDDNDMESSNDMASSWYTVAFKQDDGSIVMCDANGEFTRKTFDVVLRQCLQASHAVMQFMRTSLSEKVRADHCVDVSE